MIKPSKKSFKKSGKFLSILIVFLLISSVFIPVVSSIDLFNENEKSEEKSLLKFSQDRKTIRERMQEKLQQTKEKIEDMANKLGNRRNTIEGPTVAHSKNTLINTIHVLSEISNLDSSIAFYVNYNGTTKQTELKFLRDAVIDINGDGKNDISARYFVYPFIVLPFSLSINFKLKIEKLEEGFSELDENAYFEAYAELFLPGILSKNNTGDRIRFGYESLENEKIPNSCDVTFKFLPHLLSLTKKAGFRLSLLPDITSAGNSDLNLILSYADMDGENVSSEDSFRVVYSPIVATEISIERSRNGFGLPQLDFERKRFTSSLVDLYYSKTQGENSTYFYVKNLPDHVTFSSKIGKEGLVEFDTHGKAADEIGICDDFIIPVNKVYFTGLTKKAGIEWDFALLKDGKANASIYTEGSGVAANAHLVGSAGGILDFVATSQSNIDCSVDIDLPAGYAMLKRSTTDLSLMLSVLGANGSTLVGSLDINKVEDEPFEIIFGDIADGEAEISLAGKNLDISNLDITVHSELAPIEGNYTITMDHLVKEKSGSINTSLSLDKQSGNVSGSCRFDIVNGVNITDLSLKFNNFVFHRGNINIGGNSTRWYNFSINGTVEWHVANDFSWGNVLIKAGSFANFAFDSSYSKHGEEYCTISGMIRLDSLEDSFNLSWYTVDGNLSFYVDGSGAAGLSDFHFWLKDKADISIPEISINFEINTYEKDGELTLYLDDNTVSADINIEGINITDLFGVTFKASIDTYIEGSAAGTIIFAWNESGITSIDGDFVADATGSIDITNFVFKYKETLVDISIGRLYIAGNLNVNLSTMGGNLSISANVGMTDIILSDVSIYTSISSPLAISTTINVTFNGSGFLDITYENGTVLVDGGIYDDSDIVINSLWFLAPIPGTPIELNIESLHIYGSTTLLFNADTSEDIPFFVTFTTTTVITADAIYIGLAPYLQIFIRDFAGDASNGFIGLGLNLATGQPIFDINKSSFYLGNIIIVMQGSPPAEISNITIEGSAQIEGFLDLAALSYVYIKGRAIEDTTVTLEDLDVSIVLEPGELDILLEQTILDLLGGKKDGCLYVFGYSSGWIAVKINDTEIVRLVGTLDLWVDVHISDDGTISAVIDAKEASGAIILADILRAAGELNAHIDFSVKINKTGGSTSISDIYVNVSGEISGVVQVKANDSDWVPIYPFGTSGQVMLLVHGPSLVSSTFTTPTDNKSVSFEAWYAPPFSLDPEDISPYTYNISFDDGTYYEITTNETRILKNHLYTLGEYTPTVTLTTVDPLVDPVYDSIDVEVIQKITYLGLSFGPSKFTYDEIEGDGRIHTWFTVVNKDEGDYLLEWEAFVQPESGLDEGELDPIVEPESGVLSAGETVRVNVSFYPPLDNKEHAIYIGADNTNYSGPGEDGGWGIVKMVQSLSLVPGAIYLPGLNPGGTISSSFWIWNNKKEPLNWSISDYPNENYSFSSTEGTILGGGAKVVYFDIIAPNENGVNLGGDIEVMDVDDPVNVATVPVYVKTRGQSSGDGNVTVTEDVNGNVSIAIGGSNEIHLNNFVFQINGVTGAINGDFIFDTQDSYVFINWTKNDLTSFSVDGDAEFSIENFAFSYGENISIVVSRVIAGGLHCSEGKKGSFTLIVDDTFVDVDIDVHFNQSYSNFSLSGNINIDIDTVTNGDLVVTWDLEGETKDISIDGELLHTSNMDVLITDFILHVNNFTLDAGLLHFDRIVLFSWNETSITMESSSTIQAEDIYFSFNADTQAVTIDANVEIDGYLTFEFKPWGDGFMLCIDTTGFTVNGWIYVEYGEYHGNANILWKIVGWFCIGLETS